MNWDRPVNSTRSTVGPHLFGSFLLVSPSGHIILPFLTCFQTLLFKTSGSKYFAILLFNLCFATVYSRSSFQKRFDIYWAYKIKTYFQTQLGDRTANSTCILFLDNRMKLIQSIKCDHFKSIFTKSLFSFPLDVKKKKCLKKQTTTFL